MANPLVTAEIPFWSAGGFKRSEQELWDRVTLYDTRAGLEIIELPGIAQVQVTLKHKYKPAEAQGNDLPPMIPKGMEPKEVTVTLRLYTQDHLSTWRQAIKQLSFDAPGQSVTMFGIDHPQCSLYGITKVIIESIQGNHPNSKDPMVVTLRCKEVGEQKKQAVAKPVGAAGRSNILGDPKTNPQGGLSAAPRGA